MFLLITTFAQISAAPVILYNFRRFYITGFFSNIFLIPLSVGLIFSSLLSFIFPFFFSFAGFIADIFLKLMHIFALKSPEFNFISPLSFIVFWYSLLVLILLKNLPKGKKFFLVLSSFSFIFSLFQLNYVDKGEEIYFFSSKTPCIFIKEKQKGILFSPDDFKDRNFLKSLSIFLKSEKVKEITLIYTGDSLNHTGTLNQIRKYLIVKNVFSYREKWNRLERYGYKIERQGWNFIIEKHPLKVLIAVYVDEEIKNEGYNVFYLNNYKKKKKIVKGLKELKTCLKVFPAKQKKYEKFQGKSNNYFLDDGCVIIGKENNSLNIKQL